MRSYMEEYHFQYPVAIHHGVVNLGSKMTMKLPFLTNSKDLAEDEVLVLPFDGGIREMFCESFSQHAPMQMTP